MGTILLAWNNRGGHQHRHSATPHVWTIFMGRLAVGAKFNFTNPMPLVDLLRVENPAKHEGALGIWSLPSDARPALQTEQLCEISSAIFGADDYGSVISTMREAISAVRGSH